MGSKSGKKGAQTSAENAKETVDKPPQAATGRILHKVWAARRDATYSDDDRGRSVQAWDDLSMRDQKAWEGLAVEVQQFGDRLYESGRMAGPGAEESGQPIAEERQMFRCIQTGEPVPLTGEWLHGQWHSVVRSMFPHGDPRRQVRADWHELRGREQKAWEALAEALRRP